jgi:PKD repeat protein
VVFTSNAVPAGCTDSLSYHWDFGDGTGSTERNPVHTYWAVNTFHWNVTASVNGITATQVGTVTVTQPPCEGFTCAAAFAPSSGQAPLAVSFSASADPGVCTGPVSYSWDFGDGQSSSRPEEVHTYLTPGTFHWALTVMADGVPCTRQGAVTVTCTAPVVHQVTQKGDPFRLKIETQATLAVGWKVYLAGQGEPWAHLKVKGPTKFVIEIAGSLFKKDGSETLIRIVNGDGCATTIAYNRKAKSWRPM